MCYLDVNSTYVLIFESMSDYFILKKYLNNYLVFERKNDTPHSLILCFACSRSSMYTFGNINFFDNIVTKKWIQTYLRYLFLLFFN